MTEQAQRQAVLAEAMTWLGTPWHHAARVRGAGVDCAQFLIAVFTTVGLVPDIMPGIYPIDWHMHRNEPRFLHHLTKYTHPVEQPRPADIAMFRFGRHAAHGAIIIEWPTIIHAYLHEGGVVLANALAGQLGGRGAGFYRLNDWV